MKIGMNSQTLRFIFDSGDILDYHITDGSTSSHFMRILSMNDREVKQYREMLSVYEHYTADNETTPLSWGGPNDKLLDIQYTEVNSIIDTKRIKIDPYTAYAVPGRSIINRPPTSRQPKEYTRSNNNYNNFKKLFNK